MYVRKEIGDYLVVIKAYKLDKGVRGIKSICSDGLHIFLCDVDDVNIKWLKDRIEKLIKHFKISDVHVLVTGINRFALVCVDKFTSGEIIDMQEWFDDKLTYDYRMYGICRHGWVQRTSEKYNKTAPQYLMTIKSSYSNRKQSSAHAEWLKNYYGVQIRLRSPDYKSKIVIDTYPVIVKD